MKVSKLVRIVTLCKNYWTNYVHSNHSKVHSTCPYSEGRKKQQSRDHCAACAHVPHLKFETDPPTVMNRV